jgi:hypothetical protein
MSETDPELGASWRAASREQPPAALDDAIRAAARREVRAKPGRLRAAPRWWPLAAAATVAAVAVGIVQMAPPEQVTPTAFPRAADAARQDVKADTAKPKEDAAKRDTIIATVPETPGDARREEVRPVAKERRSGPADEKNRDSVSSAGRFAAAPNASFQEKKATPQAPAQRAEQAAEREETSKKTELAAASSLARRPSDVASPPSASTSRNEVQPFPASPSPTPAEPGASNAPAPVIAAASTAAPAAPPAAAPAPSPPLAARTLAAQSSAPGARSSNVAAGVAGNIASRGAAMSNAELAVAKDSDAVGKAASAETDKAAPERRKDAVPLAPDEWIKRIRRLIAEGRNDDAAKELTAFRREYKERSDSLLPSDLRTFRQ